MNGFVKVEKCSLDKDCVTYLESIAGVTDSPNRAMGFGTDMFFSNNFRRSLMGNIAGSGERVDAGDGLSNKLRFSRMLRRDAVSVIISGCVTDCDVNFGGDLATGVTVTVFSVLQVLAGTSGFSFSGDEDRADVTKVRAGFGGPSGSALASMAASAAFCGLTNCSG